MRQTPPTGPSSATGASEAAGVGAVRGEAAAAGLGVATAVVGGGLAEGAGAPWQATAMTRLSARPIWRSPRGASSIARTFVRGPTECLDPHSIDASYGRCHRDAVSGSIFGERNVARAQRPR